MQILDCKRVVTPVSQNVPAIGAATQGALLQLRPHRVGRKTAVSSPARPRAECIPAPVLA